MSDIETPRLLLRLLPLEALAATIERDREAVERLLGLAVPQDWLAEAWLAEMRFEQWQDDPPYAPWSIRAIALKETGQMLGHMNCHDRPRPDLLEGRAPNGIELGYTIFEPHRRRGYAFEAITGYMGWAAARGVDNVVLSISPDNQASLALAGKFAIEHIGSHIDEIDGYEDIYLIRLRKT